MVFHFLFSWAVFWKNLSLSFRTKVLSCILLYYIHVRSRLLMHLVSHMPSNIYASHASLCCSSAWRISLAMWLLHLCLHASCIHNLYRPSFFREAICITSQHLVHFCIACAIQHSFLVVFRACVYTTCLHIWVLCASCYHSNQL